MKLATWTDGSRDGQLVVVSRDLAQAHFATGLASTLQQVLDDWNFISPQLEDLYATLNGGKARHAFPFDARRCMAPLPRAYQWLDSTACTAAAADPARSPAALYLHQSGSDHFLGPCEDVRWSDAHGGIVCQATLAVVTADLPCGTEAQTALDGVRLLLLANRWVLHTLAAAERAGGWGLVRSQPATAFAPVAVTPEELGADWQGGRARLRLQGRCIEQLQGPLDTAACMHWHFGQVIEQATCTRGLRAGSLVGSGPLLCMGTAGAGQADAAAAPGLRSGDRIHLEAFTSDGQSLFGAIEQGVASAVAQST